MARVLASSAHGGEDLLAGTLNVPQNAAVVTPALSMIERPRKSWFVLLVSLRPTVRLALQQIHRQSMHRAGCRTATFVPKPTQRLLDVRTEQLAPEEAERAVSLIGRIIADPNSTSLVQSINGGRVMAPDGGMPRIGQAVKKGDLLARVEPTLPQADCTTILEKLGEVEQLISVAEARLRRIRVLVEKQVAPQSQLHRCQGQARGFPPAAGQILHKIHVEAGSLAYVDLGIIAAAPRSTGAGGAGEDVISQLRRSRKVSGLRRWSMASLTRDARARDRDSGRPAPLTLRSHCATRAPAGACVGRPVHHRGPACPISPSACR